MNQKTLKKLRAVVRQLLGDKAPVRSLVTPTKTVLVPDFSRGLKLDGTPRLKPMDFPLPAFNAPGTQRGIYRRIKKQRRNGTAPSQQMA